MDAAIAILDGAIEAELAQNASYPAALKQVMRAEALLQIDEREEAHNAVDTALQSSGDDPAILVPASIILAELGETDRAEAIATNMSKSSSRSQRAYANTIRAQVAYVRGEPTMAIEYANAAIELADLWLINLIRANIYLQTGFTSEAAADLQVCQERIGEGIAVFLNDRPSFRLLRDLEAAIELTNSPQRAASSDLQR